MCILKRTLITLVLGFVLPTAQALSGDNACGSYKVVVKNLNKTYGEYSTIQGMESTNTQLMMEIFISEKGTWTLGFHNANGTFCVAATGDLISIGKIKPAKPGKEM